MSGIILRVKVRLLRLVGVRQLIGSLRRAGVSGSLRRWSGSLCRYPDPWAGFPACFLRRVVQLQNNFLSASNNNNGCWRPEKATIPLLSLSSGLGFFPILNSKMYFLLNHLGLIPCIYVYYPVRYQRAPPQTHIRQKEPNQV